MLKLISLNIEGDNHIDKERFMPFLEKEAPDALCLQEVFEEDLNRIGTRTGMTLAGFWPMCLKNSWLPDGPKARNLGVAIFSRHSFENVQGDYYVGTANDIPAFKKAEDTFKEPNTINLVLGRADIAHEGKMYTIATTHFTWTPEGSVTEYQLTQLDSLFGALEKIPTLILCGDFNAPRGKETWQRISARYTDNIPVEYKTSIDQTLHRKQGLMYVVDGLFTTPEYKATDVRLADGVSDHMAIVAQIGKLLTRRL